MPNSYIEESVFRDQVFEAIQVDGVFFPVVDVKRKRAMVLCICSDGVMALSSRCSDTMMFFHHFARIQNFIAPPKGLSDSSAEPAGYALYFAGGNSQQLLFQFETARERHLFLNILSRYSSTFVQRKREHKNEAKYKDYEASMGVDSASLVASIRARRTKRRATIGQNIRCQEDAMVSDIVARNRARANTK